MHGVLWVGHFEVWRSIHDTISKNNVALFKHHKSRVKTKQANAVAMLKDF